MTMPTLRDILNETPADAGDVEYNFNTIETHIANELVPSSGPATIEGPVTLLTPGTEDPHLITKAQLDALLPAGMLTPFSGGESQIPDGWAPCNGQEESETDDKFARLKAIYEAQGYPYNDGNEQPGNFRLPDMRGRLPAGLRPIEAGKPQQALGEQGGEDDATLPIHTHKQTAHTHSMNSHTHGAGSLATNSTGSHTHNVNPPNTTSTSDGSHTHDTNLNSSTQKFESGTGTYATPGTAGSNVNTKSAGSHTHNVNIAAFDSGSAGSHSHSVSGTTGTNNEQTGTGTSNGSTDPTEETGDDPVNKNWPRYTTVTYMVKL